MRKPCSLLLPSSLFQKGITADEAAVYGIQPDRRVVRKGEERDGEGKGREQEEELIMEPELRLIEKHMAGGLCS